MKNLIILIAFLFSGSGLAGEATLNWIKPNPMWEPNADGSPFVAPPNWTIDEYRVKCAVIVNGQPVNYTRIVSGGYDVETVTYTDLPNGDTTCIMTSFSVGNGLESVDSNSVNKFVMDPATPPAPPTIFDFIPLVSHNQILPKTPYTIVSTSRIVVADQILLVECITKRKASGRITHNCGQR